ncbi:putative pimeloyl-CoA synthetase [Pseudooceanicola batsensis HTCC2597]|uniref:Putative pimeloyl-CoA synthetase n=1 Tax=Pseudooceanicola batsensis (strain ATCC BAA-863 / DSM 15984 / KCTC 12145 / HTCC2597) TaxID=252305 RepID=A3TZG5_PSEBH|nr:acetate--CoA ligase [Pseudooceanicola batsensis]EAQ02446.1 putative pimeloyl-CoA synthetase [Pseudooceanicola batsensis HTCC2597]
MRNQGGSEEDCTAVPSDTEKLRRVLNARSIAVVGASDDLRKPGGRVVNALLHNSFPGKVYPVNPGRETIQGLECHPSLAAIAEPVDLVILSVPADDVPNQLRMGCDCGVGGFIVFASGFSEIGPEGVARQAEISKIVQDAGIPMIGPNCLGIMNGNHKMLASSTVVMGGRKLPGGNYGFISQSGALGTYWLDMSMKAGLGVSSWISTGNEADVDLAACLDYLVEDDETEVIGLYIEGVRDGAAFRAAARKAFERRKPVLVLKSGSSRQGATAAASHTGALAGEDEAYDAVFRQYNICRSDSLTDMANKAEILLTQPRSAGQRVVVISVSGGAGVLMTDAAVAEGLDVPDFSPETKARLVEILPGFASPQNPIDLTAQIVMHKTMLREVLQIISDGSGFDGVLLFMGGLSQIAEELADALVSELPRDMPCALTWQAAPEETVQHVRDRGVPVYGEIGDAARALAAQFRMGAGWDRPVPPEAPTIQLGGRATGPFAVEHLSKDLLCDATSLQRPVGVFATDADQLKKVGASLTAPLVVKLQSPEMLHKSGSGGIALGLESVEAAAEAARKMIESATERGISVDGVLVEEMVPFDHEFIVGLRCDPVFGPMLVLGRGGVTVELEPDVTRAFLPLTAEQIEDLIRSLRAAPLLEGFRGAKPCDIAGLARTVKELCDLYLSDETLSEIEINPLVADRNGRFVALDALVARSLEDSGGGTP